MSDIDENTPMGLFSELKEIYRKIKAHSDKPISTAVVNPLDLVKAYNRYVQAGFKYREKLGSLKKINFMKIALR